MDGWTDIIGRIVTMLRQSGEMSAEAIAAALEESDFQKMDDIRARVDEIVEDPATAAALKPWYKLFCKRPCFHDAYLQSFNRPNVQLVDTDGKGVDRITPNAVVVGDTEYEIDCLIYATGFEVSTAYTQKLGFDPVGRGGLSLSEHWANGMRTMHGMHMHGFPSLFLIGHAQGAFTANYPHLLEECATQIVYVLTEARDRGAERGRGDRRGGGGVGARDRGQPAALRRLRQHQRLHARLLQQRGPDGPRVHRLLLQQGRARVLRAHRRVAGARATSRASSSARSSGRVSSRPPASH